MGRPPSLPDRYTAPPTREQKRLLRQYRADAEAAPLRPGERLPVALLERYSESRALPSPSTIVVDSPVPLRALDDALFRALDPRRHSSSLRLRLDSPLDVGTPKWSQVWRGTVERDGVAVGKVVVKLLVEALFPEPEGVGVYEPAGRYDLWSAETLLENEARAYAAFRPLQGRDVCHCYGVAAFRAPWGEQVPGLLLEDLADKSATLEYAFSWEDADEVTVEEVDGLITSAFEGQRRLQDLGICCFEIRKRDLLES